MNHARLEPRAIGRDLVAGVPAVVGEATQPSELGTMVLRFAFLEDGNRLLNLTLTAPGLFADSARDAWFRMLQSFALETPRGSRFKSDLHPDDVRAAPIPEPAAEAKPNVAAPHADVLDDLEAAAREEYPAPEFARLTVGKIDALGVRKIAELILDTCVFEPVPTGDESEPPLEAPSEEAETHEKTDSQPAWWHEALALEASGNLPAAEKRIRAAVDHIGYASSTAEMYRLRMLRLKENGDDDGALEAFGKSSDFMGSYAGMATSGGEGEALSLERDQFRAQLVHEYGGDPEAKS